ncbi:MAG TPA: phosphotransferase family protein, partial [Actinoplanes sp.]
MDMSQRLQRFLAAVEPDRPAEVVGYQPISGGYSRISARASVRWADGTEETFILRGDPPAGSGVFVSDRAAEWALLQALPGLGSVATARARWYDSTGAHLGAPCIVMDCAEATSLQAVLADSEDPGPLSDLFVDTAAAIHRSPLDRLPASMPHPADWSSYLDSVLDTYDRVAAAHPAVAPVLRHITWWAAAHRPPPIPLGLVHGDCQPSNILVADGEPPLVIDWEFAHIGDPREDLG